MPANTDPACHNDAVNCYAIRRVNPFLGVLQIVETSGGRAISANGVVWDIQVLAERGSDWGSLNRNNRQLAFYRYGLWSLEDGLVSRPLAPHLESDPLTHHCNTLIQCIRDRLGDLPFRLEDNRELWLFDRERQPLALLATLTPGSRPPSPEPRYWSSSIGANGVPSQHRYPGAGELETLVKQRAGFNIDKRWVIRHVDGSGVTETRQQHLSADRFPAFLLSDDWPDPAHAELVSQYIEWIAPSLLTLQNLDRPGRLRLENCLTRQAISVEHHYRLYPEVINEKHLTAARVQCRLQRSE
ncbi:MAG: hypothetical protein JSW45_00295 [Thiotrichales bacterium]|nr:MAG: hypothetical protein JSW45_00295 [Thiotrichales bacterium]